MFAKNYHLYWIAGRADILSKYVIYIFSILGVVFAVSSLYYFQMLQLRVVKKFCCIALLYSSAQRVCLRFLKSHFKLEILIFLSFVVSSCLLQQICSTKKILFCQKIPSAVKSEPHFSREAIENRLGKVLKENLPLAEVGALQSHSQCETTPKMLKGMCL